MITTTRQSGSNAEPFAIELVRRGVLEPMASCTFELRQVGVVSAVVGPVPGTVPLAGVAYYAPSVADVTQPAGSYEYRFTCLLASGASWISPWIRHEIR